MEDIKFPYYSGNINLTKCLGHISLNQFVYSHKHPKIKTRETIRAIRKSHSPEEKRELKQKLYSFTPAVYIKKGDKKRYNNVQY